jgi:ubiquitin-protein ligase
MQMYTILHYGESQIHNFNLLHSKRLKKEVGVLHKIIEGDTNFLKDYDKIRNKITNPDILENIFSISVSNQDEVSMEGLFQNKYLLPITISFPKEYPFRPPSVKLMSGENYVNILGEIQGNGFYKGEKCLCCSTICCKGNWGPQKDIFDVVIEIYKNLNMVYNPINEEIYKNILNKHLGYLID